jgi:hypothetical protein
MTSELLTAFASLSVAIAVALITWRQWLTGRDSLKHELFDRRYAIYEKITGFLAGTLQDGVARPDRQQTFLQETKQAYFVFACDGEVRDLVSHIYKQAVDLHALEAERPYASGPMLVSNIEQQREIKDNFTELLASMETRFERYLRLDH